MENLLEQLRSSCHDEQAVRIWAYGYLDSTVSGYTSGLINEQQLRKMHYQLTAAVEARFVEIRRELRAAELRNQARAMANMRGTSSDVIEQ